MEVLYQLTNRCITLPMFRPDALAFFRANVKGSANVLAMFIAMHLLMHCLWKLSVGASGNSGSPLVGPAISCSFEAENVHTYEESEVSPASIH